MATAVTDAHDRATREFVDENPRVVVENINT